MASEEIIRPQGKFTDFHAVFCFMLLSMLFFNKVIWSGHSLWGSDFAFYFYPWKQYIYDHVRSYGALPSWNPYLFAGIPCITNIQASMFYPLGFLFYLLPADHAYVYTIIIHCILGSFFMYVFIRSISINSSGAFFAGVVFIYNGFFLGHLYAGHLTFVQNYIWIPLILFFLNRFIKTFEYRHAFLSGLFLGIQILGGFPQIAFYTILCVFGFGLYHMGYPLRSRQYPDVFKIFLGTAMVAGIGFSLSAVQVLPTMEFTSLSTRAGGVSYDFATFDSLDLKAIVSFLVPDIFGHAGDRTYWPSLNTSHFWETCGYVGLLPICLIFISARSNTDNSQEVFYKGIIILSLFIALGRYNPLYPLIYRLPGFNSFRIPAQILYLYVFGMAAATGIALDRISTNRWHFNRFGLIVITGIGFFFILLVTYVHFFTYNFFFYLFRLFGEVPVQNIDMNYVSNKITHAIDRSALLFLLSVFLLVIIKKKRLKAPWFNILVIMVLIIDLALFGMEFIKSYQYKVAFKKQHLVVQISKEPSKGRVLALRPLFNPNDGLLYRFPSVTGYDPLILKRYSHYIRASSDLPPDDRVVNLSGGINPHSKMLRLLNLRQVIGKQGVETVSPLLSYATLVSMAIVKASDEVIPFIKSDKFDPTKMVVLEDRKGMPDRVSIPDPNRDYAPSCSVQDRQNGSIHIRTISNQAGYLVLNEIFYPGWQATVDGKKTSVLCANYILCAIPLTPGKHEIHMRFVSWPFRIGLVVSLVTLFVILGVVCRFWSRSLNTVERVKSA